MQHKQPRFSGYLSTSDLRARGWTPSLLRKYLPNHCRLEINPHYGLGRKMRLFSTGRVQEIEMLPDFQEARAKALKLSARQSARLRSVATHLLDLSNSISLDIPPIDFDELLALAHEAYLQNQIEIKLMEDRIQANRLLAVEYLEQRCEPALWKLDDFFQVAGVREARAALRHRIYMSISLKYPELSQECARRAALLNEEA